MKKNGLNIFLDSGAFSAWSKGVKIDIMDYIKFIKENKKYISVYSVLDSIGDAKSTLRNQRIMERNGLKPLPCFHYGEDVSYLKMYLKKYNYISLGGMVPVSSKDLVVWLDRIFSKHICGPDGMPKVKVHGFGMSSLRLMKRYPWYSVDSTSWVLASRFGVVFVPKKKEGKYDYMVDPYKVSISNRKPIEGSVHIDSFSSSKKREILRYCKKKGFALGKSKFKKVREDYKLKEKERWHGKAKNGKREVEVVLEEGLSNAYTHRDRLNIAYFVDLEGKLPKWPWPFKVRHNSLGLKD